MTFSIGVATFLRPPASVDEMILRADELMYEAKRSGKDRWRPGSWDATETGRLRLVATCARGTEGAVRGELASLGMRHLRGSRGAVTFEGRMEDGMRACLWSRTAMRVLAPLASFPCPDAAALYDGVRTVDWTEWLTVKTTLAVDATGTAPGLHHTGFVALKVKDGVVDSLRDALGGRPDVDTRDPDVRIVVHLSRGQAELSLDLSGAPLYRRGYRTSVDGGPAQGDAGRLDPGARRGGARPPLPRPALRLGDAGHRARAGRPPDRARAPARLRLPALAPLPRGVAVVLGPA